MSGMLEAYLAFARGDSGEVAQPTDMTMALEELRSDAERNGHTATVSFHGLPVVTVKPASFKRCLGNLVSNAARHANTISITGHRDHRYLTVTVDDNGPGIPVRMRERVQAVLAPRRCPQPGRGRHGLGARHRPRHRPLAWRRHHARRQPDGRPACGGAGAGVTACADTVVAAILRDGAEPVIGPCSRGPVGASSG